MKVPIKAVNTDEEERRIPFHFHDKTYKKCGNPEKEGNMAFLQYYSITILSNIIFTLTCNVVI